MVDTLNPQPARLRHLISKFSGGNTFVQGGLLPVTPLLRDFDELISPLLDRRSPSRNSDRIKVDSSRSRAGLAPALFFRCRVSTSKKNGLKDHLARYRQIKVSVIGRKSQQTISIPELGRTNDEQGVLLNHFFCIVFIQPILLMIEPLRLRNDLS